MKRPSRPLVVAACLPFAAGCFSLLPTPLPEPPDRSADIRGVVRDDGDEGERVEFRSVNDVRWSESEVVIVGVLEEPEDGTFDGEVVTRSYPLSELSGVLTRQLDVDRTSFLVLGVALATIVTTVIFVFDERTGGAGTTPPG